LKFQAVAEKTAKDARGLLYFAAPGIPAGTVSKPKLWRVQLWQPSNLDCKLTGANNIPSVTSVWYSQWEVCRLLSRSRSKSRNVVFHWLMLS